MDTSKVTRVEVIDHTDVETNVTKAFGKGRVFVLGPDSTVNVELRLQDQDRTLKVFISNKR